MGSPDKPISAKAMFVQANQRLREWDELRKQQDGMIRSINKVHKTLVAQDGGEKFSIELLGKLRHLYTKVKELAEREESVLSIVTQQLDVLISPGGVQQLQQQQPPPHRKKPASSAADVKRKRINSSANDSSRMMTSPPVSRIPSSHLSISIGDQVAAKIPSEDADNHQWIEVKVTRIDRESGRFEVIDEELEDEVDGGGGVRNYKLLFTSIIPFPKVETSAVPDYLQGSDVLAVYPGTTSLYKASVVGPHRKKMKLDDVLLLEFDGDEEEGYEGLPQRAVPLNRVVTLPEGYRQMISI